MEILLIYLKNIKRQLLSKHNENTQTGKVVPNSSVAWNSTETKFGSNKSDRKEQHQIKFVSVKAVKLTEHNEISPLRKLSIRSFVQSVIWFRSATCALATMPSGSRKV